MEELDASIAMSDLFPFLRSLKASLVTVYLDKIFRILDGIIDRRLAEAAASSTSRRELDCWMDNYVSEVGLDRIGCWGLTSRTGLDGNMISIGCQLDIVGWILDDDPFP
ncbi:hypothetical protein C2845_PM06G24730 [Panicum miliaceum]|uniref:Uncharacterized protein n=1 Tax=Panicum miliaceum TaxID=4540 RepID=A0A3L6R998_PANMI|nr:hypothetical protein C2845_PM06G24730 [Panicum miliaceum]